MSYNVTEQMLRDAFSPFGTIVDIKLLMNDVTNKPKGCGFVVYDNPLSVLRAFQHDVVIDVLVQVCISRVGETRSNEVRSGTG